MKIYRAPWDSKFHTFYCKGWFAHEVQVGRLVIQLAHKHLERSYRRFQVGRLLVWSA